MADLVTVINASPLIFLASAGMLDFLRPSDGRVFVPDAVMREVSAKVTGLHPVPQVAAYPWLEVVAVGPIPLSVLEWDLGAGESAVLAYALAHTPAGVVLDDLAARRCASAHGLSLSGTLGLVLKARQQGRIPSARETLLVLRSHGMYLSDSVLRRALAEIGESF